MKKTHFFILNNIFGIKKMLLDENFDDIDDVLSHLNQRDEA